MPAESIAKVDLLLGQATMLTADRWDDLAAMIQEAMGISLLMAATHPASRPVDVPGLNLTQSVPDALERRQSRQSRDGHGPSRRMSGRHQQRDPHRLVDHRGEVVPAVSGQHRRLPQQ